MNNFNRFISFKIVLLAICSQLVSCSTLNFFKDDSVSKEEYEDLLKKYKALVGKKSPQLPNTTSTQLDDVESVNNFRSKLLNTKRKRPKSLTKYDRLRVQKDLGLLYQAFDKFNKKKFGDAIILLKELENSQVYRIKAQSRFLFGRTMEEQGELDVSMQIYEEILISMQDTIFAQLALERLIQNTRSLGLNNKNKYFTKLYARFTN